MLVFVVGVGCWFACFGSCYGVAVCRSGTGALIVFAAHRGDDYVCREYAAIADGGREDIEYLVNHCGGAYPRHSADELLEAMKSVGSRALVIALSEFVDREIPPKQFFPDLEPVPGKRHLYAATRLAMPGIPRVAGAIVVDRDRVILAAHNHINSKNITETYTTQTATINKKWIDHDLVHAVIRGVYL